MKQQKKTSHKKKLKDIYEPNKVAFGVASVAALALMVFATLLITSV